MILIGTIISIIFIIAVAYALTHKFNPQIVLLTSGLLMLGTAMILGTFTIDVQKDLGGNGTGWIVFDIFRLIKEVMNTNMGRVGLMIMTIGGYVAYMKSIQASDALVYVSMRPLMLFRKAPDLAAILVLPIGQMLFVCTPSAAGLGLLLVASVFPILVNLGVSRLTAVSVISACTIFDMGPGSANTARAAELAGMTNMQYFVEHQLPLAIPVTILLMVLYFACNRYFDEKDRAHGIVSEAVTDVKNMKVDAPLIYAILPVLPLALLIIFSNYFQLFGSLIVLDTTTAMFISLFVTISFELIRYRSVRKTFAQVKAFWTGMGTVFGNVVTLIISAEIFSKGLISLGFIDSIVNACTHMGFPGALVSVVIIAVIFMAAILMGSGNASFFSFGPLVPDIAAKVGMKPVDMLLPMQLSSSMGRAISPIAGIIVAVAEVAGVKPNDLVKRNAIPLTTGLLAMVIIHYIF
ncbi:C4-dicarboxylate transporter DcuC [Prevotella sp. KH2C16]|uniref:C4-dicarboxylate transporter DcuC n=1 Tax=Prevotella sp. KH2C16 TaxID=1855325 RepID=UPI0008E27574|nr:C4-dicarboxylate transporter, DcuC family [Prevotella sp. KH2C16]